MEMKLNHLVKEDTRVKTVDKLLILTYNLILITGACYLVYYKDASAWLFLLALIFAGSWKESKKDD